MKSLQLCPKLSKYSINANYYYVLILFPSSQFMVLIMYLINETFPFPLGTFVCKMRMAAVPTSDYMRLGKVSGRVKTWQVAVGGQ